jgi:hypothetical protein
MTTSAEADGIEHNMMRMDCMYVQCADRFIRRVFLVEKHVHRIDEMRGANYLSLVQLVCKGPIYLF